MEGIKMSEEEEKKQQEENKETPQPKPENQDNDTGAKADGAGKEPDTQGTEGQKDEDKKDEVKEENERLKKENDELKQKSYSQPPPVTQPTTDKVTEEQAIHSLTNMTDEQFFEQYGSKVGDKTREQVIVELKTLALEKKNDKLHARIILNDTLDNAISENSKLVRLKGGMKEFFDKFVSEKDKTDENKVKKLVKDAEIYARGKYNMENPNKQQAKATNTQSVEPNREIGNKQKQEDNNESRIYNHDKSRSVKVSKHIKGNTTTYLVDTMDEIPRFN
jgi:hypothetical protein